MPNVWPVSITRAGFPFQEEINYDVAVYKFEDQTEQRFLRARKPAIALSYDYGRVDSALVAEITSWFLAMGGPATPFQLQNVRTGQTWNVRFTEDALEHLRGPGLAPTMPAIAFTVVGSV